jgi:Transposase DDE domain group 1
VLDLDATDDPLHGHQEGRFFHGYYDCYCYLPLYVFCGRHLLPRLSLFGDNSEQGVAASSQGVGRRQLLACSDDVQRSDRI